MSKARTNPTKPKRIVGIGASAGGLEAIQEFFENMPANTGMAFVVIQHLSPDFKSLMDQLLTKNTAMKIHTVENGAVLEADTIYLIPPKQNMTVDNGVLTLTEQNRGHHINLPIDIFFASLAKSNGQDGVGVILSGTGSDGSKGIVELANAGGLTLVQSPDTAHFDGMPCNAIATKRIDAVLDVYQMPQAILDYLKDGKYFAEKYQSITMPEGTAYEQIFALLSQRFKVDFNQYKPTTISRRIERRVSACELGSLNEYLNFIKNSDDELKSLYNDLLIGVTIFFRDREAFNLISTDVLPKLISKIKTDNGVLRVWVAACSTGEEAYSIAIAINQFMIQNNYNFEVKVFATDISKEFLEVARQGVYRLEQLENLSNLEREHYFIKNADGFQIAPALRNMVVFAPHNLLSDPPFTKMDLVCCRNFLIYIQPPMQQKIMSLLRFSLKVNGYLFLGPSESLGALGKEMVVVNSTWKIFQKVVATKTPLSFSAPPKYTSPNINYRNNSDSSHYITSKHLNLPLHAYDQLLASYIDSGILVDADREILHIFGNVTKYMQYQKGHFDSDLILNICEPLRAPLNSALYQAKSEQKMVRYSGIILTEPSNNELTLEVEPITSASGSITHYVIKFVEADAAIKPKKSAEVVNVSSGKMLEDIERELQFTRESLQATIEEVETTNEELQSTNEELLASNEELQSTNEELHSVNEELYTVNSEHQKKIEELIDLNADMDNLLRSTQIGTIFVDGNLNIKRFTPAVASIFDLILSDLGRSIGNFSHNLDNPELIPQIKKVLATGEIFTQEVKSQNGILYLMRIMPYVKANQKCDGAILTFVDMTEIHNAHERFKVAAQATPLALVLINRENEIVFCNPASLILFGYSEQEMLHADFHKLVDNSVCEKTSSLLDEHSPRELDAFESTIINKKGNKISVELTLSVVRVTKGKKVLCAIQDISEHENTVKSLQENNQYLSDEVKKRTRALFMSEQKYGELYENAPDMYVSVDPETATVLNCNKTLVDKLGFREKSEVIGRPIFEFYAEECHKAAHDAFKQFQEKGLVESSNLVLVTQMGNTIPVSLRVSSIKDSAGKVLYSMSSWRDISKDLQFQKEREAHRRSLSILEDQKTLYDTILGEVTDGWWDWNLDTNDEYMSPSFKALFGYNDDEIPNKADGWQKIIFQEDLPKAITAFDAHTKEGKPYCLPVRYHHKDGSTKWVICRGVALRGGDGEYHRMVGTHTDVTALKLAQTKLDELAYYDHLTGLANRNAFQITLERSLARAKRSNSKFCVLYVDVDDFKKVNDTWGHNIGDKLLIAFSKRLQETVRKDDYIARVGGDEFVVLIDLEETPYRAIKAVERIRKALEIPFHIDTIEVTCSLSVGIAMYPEAGNTVDALLKNADIAMYQAKEQGKNTYQFFTKELDLKMRRRYLIEQKIAVALEHHELSVVYQPIVKLEENEIIGFEALMRWHNDELGDVSPQEFIPIAEESGVIHHLTEWLISTTCSQFSLWKQQYPQQDFNLISVNFSVLQLAEKNLEKMICDACKYNDLPPSDFILEITETAVIQNIEEVKKILLNLRKKKINIALDDFGTGYSSLTVLQKLPVTYLKIDRSFVKNCMQTDSQAIIKAILNMGADLNMHIIAEGVENAQELEFLKQTGCQYAQGYLLHYPMVPQDVEELLNK